MIDTTLFNPTEDLLTNWEKLGLGKFGSRPITIDDPDFIPAFEALYKFQDAIIRTGKIGKKAVKTEIIDDLAVTTAKIESLAVTSAKIEDLAVTTAKIDSLAVTTAKINALAVTTAKIDNLAVTDAKINSLTANKLTAGTIDASVITVTNLNASNISTGTLSADRIAANSLAVGKLDSSVVSGGKIIAGLLTADNIQAGTLTVGSGGAVAITIKHTASKANAILKWEGGSSVWEDADNYLGSWAYGGLMYFWCGADSDPRLVLGTGANQNAMYGGLYIHKVGGNGGNLNVEGDSAVSGSKTFNIPHPTKKDKRLVYSCIESPEVLLMCRGKGEVEVPQHFIDITEPNSIEYIIDREGSAWLATGIRKGYKDFNPEPEAKDE